MASFFNFQVANNIFCARPHITRTMLSEEQILESAASDGSIDMYGLLKIYSQAYS